MASTVDACLVTMRLLCWWQEVHVWRPDIQIIYIFIFVSLDISSVFQLVGYLPLFLVSQHTRTTVDMVVDNNKTDVPLYF